MLAVKGQVPHAEQATVLYGLNLQDLSELPCFALPSAGIAMPT